MTPHPRPSFLERCSCRWITLLVLCQQHASCTSQSTQSSGSNAVPVDLRVVHLQQLAGTPIPSGEVGCYNNTVLDQLAEGSNSTFRFVQLRYDDPTAIQQTSSPYLTVAFSKDDDGSRILCIPETSVAFARARESRPDLHNTVPPYYELKVLYRLYNTHNTNTAPIFPQPMQEITCPLQGSSPVNYTWYMNTTGPFSCLPPTDCQFCNASGGCGVTKLSEQDQCTTARSEDCFSSTGRSDTVKVNFGCYGCVQCTASNTVLGVTTTLQHGFMLNRPYRSDIQACDPPLGVTDDLLVAGPFASPSLNITLGTTLVNVSFTYTCRQFVKVHVYHGGTGKEIIFESTDSTYRQHTDMLSYQQCRFVWTLGIMFPSSTAQGVYALEFATTSGDIVRKHNFTLHVATGRECAGNPTPLQCGKNGDCMLDWSNQPMCMCKPPRRYYGRACQFYCPKYGRYVAVNGTTPLAGDCGLASVNLACPNPGDRNDSQIIWEGVHVPHGRSPPADRGRILQVYEQPLDETVNYTCWDVHSGSYLGSVMVVVANYPVLVPGLDKFSVVNSTEDIAGELVVDKAKTFESDALAYSWTKLNDTMCRWNARDACLVSTNTSKLQVLLLDCCSGAYRGCVENSYGHTCLTVQVNVTKSECPDTPVLLGTSFDPTDGTPSDDGTDFVDIVGSDDVQLQWTRYNTSALPPRTLPSSQQRVGDSVAPCCCRRVRIDASASGGTYKVCLTSLHQSSTPCRYVTIPAAPVSLAGTSLRTWEIIGASASAAVVLLVTIVILVTVRCRRNKTTVPYTESESGGLLASHDDSDDDLIEDGNRIYTEEIVLPGRSQPLSERRNPGRQNGSAIRRGQQATAMVQMNGHTQQPCASASRDAVPAPIESGPAPSLQITTSEDHSTSLISFDSPGSSPNATTSLSMSFSDMGTRSQPIFPSSPVVSRPVKETQRVSGPTAEMPELNDTMISCSAHMYSTTQPKRVQLPPKELLRILSDPSDVPRSDVQQVPATGQGEDDLHPDDIRRGPFSSIQNSMRLLHKTDQDTPKQALMLEIACAGEADSLAMADSQQQNNAITEESENIQAITAHDHHHDQHEGANSMQLMVTQHHHHHHQQQQHEQNEQLQHHQQERQQQQDQHDETAVAISGVLQLVAVQDREQQQQPNQVETSSTESVPAQAHAQQQGMPDDVGSGSEFAA